MTGKTVSKKFPDDIDEANTQIMLRLKQSQQEIH